MTAVAAPRAPEVELGHPVRSFVAVLIVVALGLVVVQWTGVANPRLHATNNSSSYSAGPSQTYSVEVQNDSPLPLDVLDLRWPTTGAASEEVGIAPSSGEPGDFPVGAAFEPFEPFTIDGGQTAWVGVRVVMECTATIGSPVLEVRTPSGLRQQVELDRGGFEVGEPCE